MIKNLFITLIFFSTLGYHAQNIKVLTEGTKEPIVGVAIYNIDKSKSDITNIFGEVNLDKFIENEVIYFKHLTHEIKKLTKKELRTNNIIYLQSNVEGLSEIVVSASKFKQNKKDVPQKIVSINAESIKFSNPQTTADALETTGQVYIQKSQLGGGSPMIRGFSTNRLLITVDGVRMNNAIFRGGNLENVIAVDPFSIQNTEVTLGAGSVIYGSDAIGGVMSFYTQKPNLSYTDSTLVKANIITRYATASNEKTGHFDLNLGYKKWAFVTNTSYNTFGDLKMGKYGPEEYLRPEFVIATNTGDVMVKNDNPLVQRESGYNQFNFLQKARFEPSEDLSFDFGVYYKTTSNVPRYDRLIRYKGDDLRSAEWNYGPQNWFMTHVQMTQLICDSNLYDKIQTSIAYQNFQESRFDRNFQSDFRNITEESVDAYSFNIDFEKGISSKTELFYGVEYIFNKVRSAGSEENISTNSIIPAVSRYPNGSNWQSAAAYTSIKYKPQTKLVFQSGLRFNYVKSKANFLENNVFLNLPFESAKNEANALTGTAGLSWFPNKLMLWRLNTSTAFRAPNIDDIGKVFDSEPGSVVVPNDNLKPEYAYGAELGLSLNFGKKVLLDMSTYYTYLDNALVRRDYHLNANTEMMYNGELSTIQAIQNASKAWIYGFEVGLQWLITNQLKLTSQYSIISGEEEDDGINVPARHVAPDFGNTHLVWNNANFKCDFFAVYNDELSFNQLAPSEIEKDYMYALDANGNPYAPSWYTLNFRTQYQINETITLTSSLENITNQRYKTYSSGIAAAGTNFILAVKYSF